MFPDEWEKFIEPIPRVERGDFMSAYHRRLTGDDEKVFKVYCVHLAAGSVEVKTVYITARSNAHVSNICGRAKCACCVFTPGIRALVYFCYCILVVKRTLRTLLMRHTYFVSRLR